MQRSPCGLLIDRLCVGSAECLKVAKVLEVELAKLEPDHQGNDELVGDVRWVLWHWFTDLGARDRLP